MTEPDDSPSIYATVASAFGIPALLAAFVFQPVVAVLNESQRVLLWVLLIAVIGVLGLALSYPIKRWLRAVIVAATCYCLAIGWVWIAHPNAVSSAANERRCLAIQRDMLSSMPLRSDGPDLFQALGCRPQGEGSVYAERDTKEDVGAMMEQSIRRGALPYRNPYDEKFQSPTLR